jgi:ADP-ribose pyrophosphatase YjhB (NUDIX family)
MGGEGTTPLWAAGGLVFDQEGRILLLRHVRSDRWDDRWATPGGFLHPGESADEGFIREVWEETRLAVRDVRLTRILPVILTDGRRRRALFFAQFVARAEDAAPRPDPDEVREVCWFDALPADMAYREDYVEDFATWRRRFHGGGP